MTLHPPGKIAAQELIQGARALCPMNICTMLFLWGILVLVADIWAIVNIFQSNAATGRKVLWTVLVILLPVLGFIVWLIAGPRTGKA
jgi:hypothetical protein